MKKRNVIIIVMIALILVSCNKTINNTFDNTNEEKTLKTNDADNYNKEIDMRKNKRYYGDYFSTYSKDNGNGVFEGSVEISLTEPDNAEIIMLTTPYDRWDGYGKTDTVQFFGTFEVSGGYLSISNWSKIVANNITGTDDEMEQLKQEFNLEFRLNISNFPEKMNLQMKDKNTSEIVILSDNDGVKFTRR